MYRELFILGVIFIIASAILIAFPEILINIGGRESPQTVVKQGSGKIYFDNITYTIYESFLVKNNLNRKVSEYIYLSVPRNLTYQLSSIIEIQPKPISIERDDDGNIFALINISLEPGGHIWINATFRVKVSGYKIDFNYSVARWPPLNITRNLTTRTMYWDIDNKTLINIVSQAHGMDNPLSIAKWIGEWIKSRLVYKVMFVRLGSDHAIVRGLIGYRVHGDCSEVADVYVTFARILGLPSRTVYGFMLYHNNETQWLNLTRRESETSLLQHWGGHTWPQIYIEPWKWIDVEMLEENKVKIGDLSNRHIIYGVQEKKFYGTTLEGLCITSYLDLEYVKIVFRGVKD